MDEIKQTELCVFSIDVVRRAINLLLKNKNHEHVPGYLALLRSQKVRDGSPSQLSDIVEVYDRYLKVLDAGEERPYLRPFLSRGKNIWFNDNVAGSYAPSNVKADAGPFFRVVDVSGAGLSTKYSLPTDHAARASQHLLKLPVVALTAFLYRDYGFRLDAPSVASVVSLFREEFCLRPDDIAQKEAFDTLFYDDSAEFAAADLQQFQE
ncbi:MAG: hypothetical protein PBV01_21880 [Brucella anthropi]